MQTVASRCASEMRCSLLYSTLLYCPKCTAKLLCTRYFVALELSVGHKPIPTYWGVGCLLFIHLPQYLLDPGKSLTGAEVNQLHVHGGSALMEVRVAVLPSLLSVLSTVLFSTVHSVVCPTAVYERGRYPPTCLWYWDICFEAGAVPSVVVSLDVCD